MTPWTVARQAPLSMGFSRQECWSGLPLPIPGDLPDLGIKTASLASPALAGGFITTSVTREAHVCVCVHVYHYLTGKAGIFVNYRLQSRKIKHTGIRDLSPHNSLQKALSSFGDGTVGSVRGW